MSWRWVLASLTIATVAVRPASANETVVYSYDALGRLQQVTHSGTVNSGIQQTFTNDAADNRQNITVIGVGGTAGTTSGTSASAVSTDQTANALPQ